MFRLLICLVILSFVLIHDTINAFCIQPGCVAPASAPVIIRPYTLIIGHTWLYNRTLITINGTSPGPTLYANENDVLVITVINSMSNASTTIHWHGLYQYGTPEMDGAVGVSQCAIAPGSSFVYRFRALPSGTFWYHGHYQGQYTDGLYGALIIQRYGGEIQTYQDDYTVQIADFYKQPYSIPLAWYLSADSSGFEPLPDAIHINGFATKQLHINVQRSRLVRFRFINTAALSMFIISIDGVAMKVIEVDGADVVPYEIDRFSVNVAQRVSVLVDFSTLPPANSTIWLRVEIDLTMYKLRPQDFAPPYNPTYSLDVHPVAIIHVDETSTNLPSYTAAPSITSANVFNVNDDNLLDVRMYDTPPIPAATHNLTLNLDFLQIRAVSYGSISGIIYDIHTLEHNTTKIEQVIGWDEWMQSSMRTASGTITRDNKTNRWYFPYGAVIDITLNNLDQGGSHPFHYHGHSFWVLATSRYPQAQTKYSGAYVRRDTVTVPSGGWAKIRVVTVNPGAFMFHCHIDWHMSSGLAAVFVTAPEKLSAYHGPTLAENRVCEDFARASAPTQPTCPSSAPGPVTAVNINFQGMFLRP